MTTLTDRQMDTLFMIANKYCESFIATLPSITRRIEIINTGVEQDIIDECTTDLFQDINNLSLVAKNILPIKYCYSGLRFDYLWHRENKYYIGSHPMTTTHLLQAIKYQLVANFSEDLPSLLQDERSLMTVVCGYYLAFLTSINNNMTFNTKDLQGNVTRTYTPLSHVNCKRICENIKKQLEEQNYSVTDIRGDVHQLISTDMQKTRRLSKEELQEMISEYTQIAETKPTIPQLRDYYYTKIDWYNLPVEEMAGKALSNQLLMKYIKQDGLQDLMNIKHYSKKPRRLAQPLQDEAKPSA